MYLVIIFVALIKQVNSHKLCTVAKAKFILFLWFLLNVQNGTFDVSVYFRKRYSDTLHFLKKTLKIV